MTVNLYTVALHINEEKHDIYMNDNDKRAHTDTSAQMHAQLRNSVYHGLRPRTSDQYTQY